MSATHAPAPVIAPQVQRFPLGRHLVKSGVISNQQLLQALQLQVRQHAPLGEILVAEGFANREDILAAVSRQHALPLIDLVAEPPDPVLSGLRSSEFWLHHRVIPWKRMGKTLLVATSRPDLFSEVVTGLGHECPDILPVLASEPSITAAIARQFAKPLAIKAETRVATGFSCRTWTSRRPFLLAVYALVLLGTVIFAPLEVLMVLSIVACLTLCLFAALKLTGFVAHLSSNSHLSAPRAPPNPDKASVKLPKVSILVPLYQETEIAGVLIQRLRKLSYPKALLDVVLVLEAHDTLTKNALHSTDLPSWMRVIEVPAHGGLTTKPRAMNYALDFCNGDIIGVWDAEDAPATDQIEQVVARFDGAPDDVVCLQGILDYYNPRTNWRARCFTIEYSSWFRIVLPGIARMGLVVPLGGTTLFFRRDALEALGGWDAHNVTEDADLGVRLCRAGWRTELIDTVTFEEANCRSWPWVRQRSRWLKGFMVTYLVHMRSPRQLWLDLGAWRFFGFQAFFLGTLGQFLLAPVLWSFWLVLLGFGHPLAGILPQSVFVAAAVILAASEVLGICIGLAAVSRPGRRHLMIYVPTMIFYFPLGVIAAYKALGEVLFKPFFWDKTQHGQAGEEHSVC
ncbi:MAG: glycosyltransferase [Rhodobacteraceae bacterium]|nr:glycosyltransferase [Paracoccaceae bacterium]